jgi:hypothetical protein
MKILRTTLLILLSIFATNTIFARKSKHNKFVVTNSCKETPVTVKIYSKHTKEDPREKKHTHELAAGETYAFAILKTHSISCIKIIYPNGRARIKDNFKILYNSSDVHNNRNSIIHRGTMIITEDKATITTQKAGVTMEF